MEATYQSPHPVIEVYSYENLANPKIFFSPGTIRESVSNKLLSYSFSESVDTLSTPFSFSVAGEKGTGETIFDRIKPLDIVKIYEGDSQPVYIGVIHDKHISASMGDNIKRSIVFSGESIGGLFSLFMLAMDIKLMGVDYAAAASKALTIALANQEMNLGKFIKLTWDAYSNYDLSNKTVKNTKIAQLITALFGNDFVETGENPPFNYSVANAFYNQGINEITGIWKTLIPPPYYELFYHINSFGVPKIVAREAPFESEDWTKLTSYKIEPQRLVSYDIRQSDSEVYTYFYSFLEGSSLSHSQYMVINQVMSGKDSTLVHDADKAAIYGYRPLIVSYRGYNRTKNKEDDEKEKLTINFKKMNEKLKRWFGRLDEMATGSVSIVTDFKTPGNNPRAGCVAKFIGGQFYIQSVDHKWNYGGTPKLTLSMSRGGVYEDGKFSTSFKNLGKMLIELEPSSGTGR